MTSLLERGSAIQCSLHGLGITPNVRESVVKGDLPCSRRSAEQEEQGERELRSRQRGARAAESEGMSMWACHPDGEVSLYPGSKEGKMEGGVRRDRIR